MNGVLFRHTFASLRVRLLAATLGLFVWGTVLPLLYASFGKDFAEAVKTIPVLQQLVNFGGADFISLSGSIALGFIHPFTLLLMGIIAIGLPVLAIAGERQRGTLEVVLARPVPRQSYVVTIALAGAISLAVLMAMELIGGLVSATATGYVGELNSANLVALWFNGWCLFLAILGIALAASVSFDRLGQALGLTLVVVLASYFLYLVGSLNPNWSSIQGFSFFNLVKAKLVLTDGINVLDAVLLLVIAAVTTAYALLAFPRRDLAAPA